MRGGRAGECRRNEVGIGCCPRRVVSDVRYAAIRKKTVWKDWLKAVVVSRGGGCRKGCSHEMSQLTHLWLWCVLRTVVGGDSL